MPCEKVNLSRARFYTSLESINLLVGQKLKQYKERNYELGK